MTRKSWLPDNVSEYRDRHGKARYRWRKAGRTYHFKATPGTDEFMVEYAAVKAEQPVIVTTPVTPRSVDDLCARFYRSSRWAGIQASTQAVYRNEIERFRATHGGKLVKDATVARLDRVLAKMAHTPSAANNMRKRLKMLFAYAVKLDWRTDNPVDATDRFKETGSYHTWTEGQIAQYRAHHVYGTKARLAMELALNLAARRCNVAALNRQQLVDGKFHVQHAKGNNATIVRASSEALAAIEVMPVAGFGAYLVTARGKPFAVASLGNAFREWCNEAGLPPECSMHGLRKAQSRRLAESGATDAQGRAVTGHTKDTTFAYYARKADRAAMADDAMANLEAHNLANHRKVE